MFWIPPPRADTTSPVGRGTPLAASAAPLLSTTAECSSVRTPSKLAMPAPETSTAPLELSPWMLLPPMRLYRMLVVDGSEPSCSPPPFTPTTKPEPTGTPPKAELPETLLWSRTSEPWLWMPPVDVTASPALLNELTLLPSTVEWLIVAVEPAV